MPTSLEVIPNRPLSGLELRKIITDDVDAVLRRDGLFQPHIGYGRVSYKVTVELHLDNPAYSRHANTIASRLQPNQDPAIMPNPLADPTEHATATSTTRERHINSPNKERIRRGMPISVTAKSPVDGLPKTREIRYDVSVLGDADGGVDEGVVDGEVRGA